jgi:integrase
MAYAEKRGNLWRTRWRGPDGTLESKPGFRSRKDAENYGRDQEAAIRNNTYLDPRAGRITLTEWVNQWFPAQDLELNTLSTYKYTIEVLILPTFGHRPLMSLETHEIATWERELIARGYQRRTAREARSTLATILSDAMPRYIQTNPAARKRGKGRKGQRRIERAEKAERSWATPLEVLLFAERCAALSGSDADFVLAVTVAYTGMRWSEAMGLSPECVHKDIVKINWKLYELDSHFYRGRPKDGSIRDADLPPFLAELLAWHLDNNAARKCTCRNTEPPWCPGMEYVFLGQRNAHHRRSNYGTRVVRPAADGWYPKREGRYGRPAAPVLVDTSAPWPGMPLSPWPPAGPGEPYTPPTGRGVPRLAGKDGSGRCPACNRTTQLRQDGTLIRHKLDGEHCAGSGEWPSDAMSLASWLPLRPGLSPHGLRHGHQTWLDDLGIRYVLQSERMGHEAPGMRGVYSHITPRMRAELRDGLQELWETSLEERARLTERSAVAMLDDIMASRTGPRAGSDRRE